MPPVRNDNWGEGHLHPDRRDMKGGQKRTRRDMKPEVSGLLTPTAGDVKVGVKGSLTPTGGTGRAPSPELMV